LDLGVGADARDIDGGTSLQWVSWYWYSGIVALLLDYKADVNAADHTSGRRALHEAAEQGGLEIVKMLLARGAEVDARDKWIQTPLHRAAFQGELRVAEVLLKRGADVNAKTSDEKSPLDLASQPATVALLLQHAADIEHIRYQEHRILGHAAKTHQVKYLGDFIQETATVKQTSLVKKKWLKRDDENTCNRGCPDIVLEPPHEI
jgi:hypothetical protein